MDKRYQVFISSTFADLKDARQSVLKAILELDHMPAGMHTPVAEIEAAWAAEIERRVAAFDRGEMQSYPAEDVFAEARRLMR